MIFKLKSSLNAKQFPLGRILFSFLLGVVAAIYFVQQQKEFKQILKAKIQRVAEDFLDCSIDFSINNINLFNSTFIFEDIKVSSQAPNWHWNSNKITLSFSWISLLLTGKIDTSISVDQIELNSLYNKGSLAIWPHLYKLLIEPSDFPIELKEIKVSKGTLNTWNKNKKVNFYLEWTSKTKEFRNTLHSNLYITNGYLNTNDVSAVDQISGYIQITTPADGNPKNITAICDYSFATPYIDPTDKYFVSAQWSNSTGTCKINSINGTVDLSPITLHTKDNNFNISTKGYLSLTLLQKFMPTKALYTVDGNGFIDINTKINNSNYKMDGKINVENFSLNSKIIIDNTDIVFSHEQHIWNGTLKLTKDNNSEIKSIWKWNENSKIGNVSVKNNSNISLPIGRGWQIKANDLDANFNFSNKQNNFEIDGKHEIIFSNDKLETTKQSIGNIIYKNNEAQLRGKVNNNEYSTTFTTIAPYIKSLYVKNKQDIVCSIYRDSKSNLESKINLELLSKWLPSNITDVVSGQGKLIINSVLSQNILENSFKLIDGNLVIPKIYNVLKNLSSKIDFNLNNNTALIDNSTVQLHKGTINIPRGFVKFSDTYSPEFVYLPIILNNCALNFDKNLITNISGKILCQKYLEQKMLLKGIVVLEQTLCKYNVLSSDIQNLFNKSSMPNPKTYPNPDLDINIITRSPIKIKSESLETNTTVRMQLTNNLQDPHPLGHIAIKGGKINFPYKPLYITQGSIYFTAEQPNQPMIDLVAKNQIKRYNITMHISGSINNPYTIMESSPSLTEEQIGALLLVGSENTTLNMIMPAIIMQNLNNIMFGSMYVEGKTNMLLKSILKPLDHIKFIPSFSDETGRGGLRGAVEIDVNDRLRALIQKNFSLSEDTKVEVDYAITDDISIRGIKDERGDLGGEIEIRWKI